MCCVANQQMPLSNAFELAVQNPQSVSSLQPRSKSSKPFQYTLATMHLRASTDAVPPMAYIRMHVARCPPTVAPPLSPNAITTAHLHYIHPPPTPNLHPAFGLCPSFPTVRTRSREIDGPSPDGLPPPPCDMTCTMRPVEIVCTYSKARKWIMCSSFVLLCHCRSSSRRVRGVMALPRCMHPPSVLV